MIGLDANVLLRILVPDDDPAQHAAIRRFLSALTPNDPAYVSLIVLAETAWALQSYFGYGAAQIWSAFGSLLQIEEIRVEGADLLANALEAETLPGGDIADRLIAVAGKLARCEHTVTFDRAAARTIPGMRLLT